MAEPGKTANPVWDAFIAEVDTALKRAAQPPQLLPQSAPTSTQPGNTQGKQSATANTATSAPTGNGTQTAASKAVPTTQQPIPTRPPNGQAQNNDGTPSLSPTASRGSQPARDGTTHTTAEGGSHGATNSENEDALPDAHSNLPRPDTSKPADETTIQELEALMADRLTPVKDRVGRAVITAILGYKTECGQLAGEYQTRIDRALEDKEAAESKNAVLQIALTLPIFFVSGGVLTGAVLIAGEMVAKVDAKLAVKAVNAIRRAVESKPGEDVLSKARDKLGEAVAKRITDAPGGKWGLLKKYVGQFDYALQEALVSLQEGVNSAKSVPELAVIESALKAMPQKEFRRLMEKCLADAERTVSGDLGKLSDRDRVEDVVDLQSGAKKANKEAVASISVEGRRYFASVEIMTIQGPGKAAERKFIRFSRWLDSKFNPSVDLELTSTDKRRPSSDTEIFIEKGDRHPDFRSAVPDASEGHGAR